MEVTVEEVQALWRRALGNRPHSIETCPLGQARGRVLGEDMVTPRPVPSFHKSAMDGFAIHSTPDCKTYEVLGRIGAGEVWQGTVGAGQAVRIMTGAPLPEGCDRVVMQEQCDFLEGDRYMTIEGTISQKRNIICAGEECPSGCVVAHRGQLIDTGLQTVLAGLGYTSLPVYKKLKALVLTSGREIVEPGASLSLGKVYNSNRFMLGGLLRDSGICQIDYHHISDGPEYLEQVIEEVRAMAPAYDVIVSSGGISVGVFDTMPIIYEALGARVLYTRVRMRPGAASYGALTPWGGLIIGLSGNPVAAYNGWHLLAKEAVAILQGRTRFNRVGSGDGLGESSIYSSLRARLACDIEVKSGPPRYLQGTLFVLDGRLYFSPIQHSSGSALLSLAEVNGLACVSGRAEVIKKGSEVSIFITNHHLSMV